jgi:hypothetical protein
MHIYVHIIIFKKNVENKIKFKEQKTEINLKDNPFINE